MVTLTAVLTPANDKDDWRLPAHAWVDMIGLLVTLLTCVVVYKLSTFNLTDQATTLPLSSCDLQRGACDISLPDGSHLRLQVPDTPILPNAPFVVVAKDVPSTTLLLEIEIHSVSVPSAKARAEFADAGSSFSASIRLPLCTNNASTWELTLLFVAAGQLYRQPMQFQTLSTLHGEST
jgi:hypothetical protein